MNRLLLSLFVLTAMACGSREARAIASDAADPAGSAPVESAEGSGKKASGPVDFSEADLDLYERGFAKELEIVRAAQERAANAKTPEARGEAIQATWEDQSIPAAAKAAGISEERYRHTRNAVHEVFRILDFQGKIDGPMSMDMSQASEEMKARLAKDPYDALSPAAAKALRARQDRLVPAWIEYVNLTAVAG